MNKLLLINKMPLYETAEGPGVNKSMISDLPQRLFVVDKQELYRACYGGRSLDFPLGFGVPDWALNINWLTVLSRR